MEMVLNNEFCEMSMEEMLSIDGGINWDRVFGGTIAYLAATFAIATVSGPIGWVAIGSYWATCAASGAYIGYGLASEGDN